jgi:hypothetical protein
MLRETKISIVKAKKDDVIYIDKQKDDIEKDYFAKRAYCESFDTLKEGDTVEFNPFKNENGNWIAQNIKKIVETTTVTEDKSNITMYSDNTSRSIVDDFITHLNEKANTSNWIEFEDISLFVLKALGVSEIYPTPKDDNRGKCDGVFKILSISTNTPRLEVFYDCTLEEDFSKKDTQIENYFSQIIKPDARFTYKLNVNNVIKPIKETVSFSNTAVKQIWIITKNQTRLIENKQINDVSVSIKEISIFDLIEIVKNKYLDKSFSKIDNVLEELKNIGE